MKRLERETENKHPSIAKVKNDLSYTFDICLNDERRGKYNST